MIGKRYDIDHWNCTHEVAEWYELNGFGNVLRSVDRNKWDIHFVRWMRKRFIEINQPEQSCLITMKHRVGGLHVGVWDCGMIHHCYEPNDKTIGQTIRSPLSHVKIEYKEIRYWRYTGEKNNLL